MKLVTADEMRAIEQRVFDAGTPASTLMENAGRAVAKAIAERLGGGRARRVVVLVGPGNNGGDGLVAARYLAQDAAQVVALLLTDRHADDANLRLALEADVEVVQPADVARELDGALARADGVVDAILGIGRRRPLEGLIGDVCRRLQGHRGSLFAVDVPSGLDADTGDVDPLTARADVTYALGISKLGLHLQPGSQHAGEVEVLDIGLGSAADDVATELLTPEWARGVLPERPAVSNKGSFGRALIVAGSESYTGAASLSCLGALRAGAGLVSLAGLKTVRTAVAAQVAEATFLPLPELDEAPAPDAADIVLRAVSAYDALLVGPGLSMTPGAQSLARGLLTSALLEETPVIVDADGLNALAKLPSWHEYVKARCVLTPHPGEMARLANCSSTEVQADRIGIARRKAAEWGQTVVLKGANTVVAQADGTTLVSPFASALLATAGTGDVLAGTIAGLIAQGVEQFAAAGLGVYLHGAAGERLAPQYGVSGLLASELAREIALVAAELRG
jgi:NAD(P)H-hydrate epimerase